jgi:RNA polymerase sigma-70 factor (ECF subfamily)
MTTTAPSVSAAAPRERWLLSRLRAGDARAFEEVVRKNSGRMLATARRILRSDEEAHDALQDAFLAAFRALPEFDGASQLSTWLHRIVVNAALMRLRSRRRHPETSIDELLPRFDETGHRVDPEDRPDLLCEAAEDSAQTRALVRECVARLPDPYREVLVLRDFEELSTEDTAVQLGISVGAVKTRLHRARAALKTLLEREMAGRD